MRGGRLPCLREVARSFAANTTGSKLVIRNDPGPRSRPVRERGAGAGHVEGSPAAAPDTLIRTLDGQITAWSPGMEQRYGYSAADALGQTSHRLLRTAFPRSSPEIGAILVSMRHWSGGLVHRHADGGRVITANNWTLSCEGDHSSWLVTEVHSDVARAGSDLYRHCADILDVLAHELSEPMTAISAYVDGAQRILQSGWPDLASARVAMARASDQIARGGEWLRLSRELAAAMRENE